MIFRTVSVGESIPVERNLLRLVSAFLATPPHFPPLRATYHLPDTPPPRVPHLHYNPMMKPLTYYYHPENVNFSISSNGLEAVELTRDPYSGTVNADRHRINGQGHAPGFFPLTLTLPTRASATSFIAKRQCACHNGCSI